MLGHTNNVGYIYIPTNKLQEVILCQEEVADTMC